VLPARLDPSGLRGCFLDLDGTILEDARPVPGAAEAIAALERSGVRAVISTGRMLTSARRLAGELGVSAPLICYQGAVIGDPTTGEMLRHEPLDRDVASRLIRDVLAAGFEPLAFIDEHVFVARASDTAEHYARSAGVPYRIVHDLPDWLPKPVTKIVTAGAPSAMDALRDQLLPRYSHEAFIAKSLPYYLEMAAPGVSKAHGAERVCRLLGFDASQCIAFGDGENDIEMIEWAGFGVAVGGGFAGLLARADWVCPPLADDGVPRTLRAIAAARTAAANASPDQSRD
jgi:Cof subfamily protein (haloacid dehalogenase superfamily)